MLGRLTTLAIILILPVTSALAQERASPPRSAAKAPPKRYTVPEPSVIPLSWQVDFEYKTPMRLIAREPGKKDPVHYWYLLYTISNLTDRELYIMPRAQLITDKLEVIDAQMGISQAVFNKIKSMHKIPFLENPLQIIGVLLKGVDNARDGVAVFAVKEDPKSFRILFGGLSGEQWAVSVPGATEADKPTRVTLEKTRVLDFVVVGDPAVQESPTAVLESDKWEMRQTAPPAAETVDLDAAARGGIDEAIGPKRAAPTAKPSAGASPAPPAEGKTEAKPMPASAPPPPPATPAPTAAPANLPADPDSRITYDVVLDDAGADKAAVAKVLIQYASVDQKAADALVAGAPKLVRAGVAKRRAERLKKELEDVGAKATVRPSIEK